ncbi:DUF1566 domain-containing protein [Microbaculum marinisediminis]|uniref:DUF1566 domain-containing protein n=1 Tax=Microbaculum marinisediminis TaxID=2931392 RepID=A0AAW5QWL4_9HYPH|nr:DUF1566 domain-containing protein [Microbaculum sp. A6E488]MCT8970783.1 DUF1566 domain-containing protein [Microbaculum sp. A6E488]
MIGYVRSLTPILLLGFVICLAAPAYAGCTNPTDVEGAIVYNADQNVPQVCAGSTWVSLGTLNPSAGGGTCSNPTDTEGAIVYNDDYDILQYCDGENWIAVQAAPSGGFLGFSDLTDQYPSELITSNILQVDNGGAISITGGGTPQYRICADDACGSETQTWGSASGSINAGEFLQLRLTNNASGNTDTAIVTVGGASEQWSVTTSVNVPSGCPTVGNVCSDGSYYIGDIGAGHIYVISAANEANKTWNDGASGITDTNANSTTDGQANTALIVAATGNGDYPYEAALFCDGLGAHGHNDWYMPAQDELNLLWNGGTPVAGVLTDGTNYWSSTENTGTNNAYRQRFSDGVQGTSNKRDNAFPTRCVRRP